MLLENRRGLLPLSATEYSGGGESGGGGGVLAVIGPNANKTAYGNYAGHNDNNKWLVGLDRREHIGGWTVQVQINDKHIRVWTRQAHSNEKHSCVDPPRPDQREHTGVLTRHVQINENTQVVGPTTPRTTRIQAF